MIEKFGIGIDVSNITRFKKKSFNENKTFYNKIFSKNEISFCLKSKNHSEKFAGKFAIKEALIKSINEKLQFLDIETSHFNSKPTVKLVNSTKKYNFLVSLSHESDYAVAVVISEKII